MTSDSPRPWPAHVPVRVYRIVLTVRFDLTTAAIPGQRPEKETAIDQRERAALIEQLIGGFEATLTRLAAANTPEFLEIDITMTQAKVLYLLAAGDLNMSELVARLGVTMPTGSGVVDRLVEHGLIARRADPSDRRRVLVGITAEGGALLDRFRDLNARQVRLLLGVLDDDDLRRVGEFLDVLDRGVARLATAAADRDTADDLAPQRHALHLGSTKE